MTVDITKIRVSMTLANANRDLSLMLSGKFALFNDPVNTYGLELSIGYKNLVCSGICILACE